MSTRSGSPVDREALAEASPESYRPIYIYLLDEGTDVWRPVMGRLIAGDIFEIVTENSNPDDEHWEFGCGQQVRCRELMTPEGKTIMVACELLNGMTERELIENWVEQKRSRNFRRLRAGRIAEFEFLGPEYGHPSSYGYVKINARPNEDLAVEFDIEWPAEFDATYTKRIRRSIGEAIVDALFSTQYPHRGCRLRLIDFKWDAVGSSEVAVYVATLKAIQRLMVEGEWEDVANMWWAT